MYSIHKISDWHQTLLSGLQENRNFIECMGMLKMSDVVSDSVPLELFAASTASSKVLMFYYCPILEDQPVVYNALIVISTMLPMNHFMFMYCNETCH